MDQGSRSADEYLMVGTIGLDNDAWQGGFYDDDLPADWRIASYSTLLRSVMLPADEWKKAAAEDWAEDVDEAFRFLLEVDAQEIAALEALPQTLTDRVAGLVIRINRLPADDMVIQRLKALASRYPLCLDFAPDIASDTAESFCTRLEAARLWRPAQQQQPLHSGALQIAILAGEDLPQQRAVIAELERHIKAGGRAGVFHEQADNAAEQAQQTRLLAEMMGV